MVPDARACTKTKQIIPSSDATKIAIRGPQFSEIYRGLASIFQLFAFGKRIRKSASTVSLDSGPK